MPTVAVTQAQQLACHPCRLCASTGAMHVIHSFGKMPVSGYLEADETLARSAPRYELAVAICHECGFVQQANNEANDILVKRVYSQYQPTYTMSEKVTAYMDYFLDEAIGKADAAPHDEVVEIGSNDGSVLALVKGRGFEARGFEPSSTLNVIARRRGVEVVEDYFGVDSAGRYLDRHPKAKVVITRHTLEHAFDPIDFLRGIALVLAPGGIAAIEVPYLRLQMMNNQFPSMTFQHVSFFNVASMNRALEKAGLVLVDVAFVNMDGGSMIAYAVGRSRGHAGEFAEAIFGYESMLRLDRAAGYERFFGRVAEQCVQVRDYLTSLSAKGHMVLGYGAGSKGQALLNMLACDVDQVPFVIDDVPGNAGQYVPGSTIQVIAGNDERVPAADFIFITAPTHVAEIVRKERKRLGAHTRFLSIVPEFHYVTGP